MITLYIKIHTKTKLKYFGATSQKDTEAYKGSGTYWTKHVSEHGRDLIKTLRLWHFDDEKECMAFALKFSKDNNIVKSNAWANLVAESGKQTLIGEANPMFGKKHSDEVKIKSSERWAKTNSKRTWYNDGVKNIFSVDVLTSPWVKGRLLNVGSNWYNNGEIQKFSKTHPGEGWVEGQLNYEKKWFTDGTINKRLLECPEGWRLGQTRKSGSSGYEKFKYIISFRDGKVMETTNLGKFGKENNIKINLGRFTKPNPPVSKTIKSVVAIPNFKTG